MLKKVLTTLLIILLFVAVVGVVNLQGKKAIPAVKENAIRQEVKLLGYLMYPFPGYNIKYAPYFYDANVVKIQERLNTLGDMFYCGPADGYFGDQTLQAVKNFQWNEGLTEDGIVGRITWERLFYIY
jgi:murein L,D-transpeptidase YcbB/YkuD